jgi:hypothetical protein
MEIVLHEEADIDGRYGKEEVAFVIFHLLYELSVAFGVSQYKLQRDDTAPSEVCLRVLTLEA